MTVICALHHDGETWIGADSRVMLSGGTPLPTVAQKWRVDHTGRRAVGASGDGRTVMLIREASIFSRTTTASDVANFLRDLVRDDGYAGKASDDRGAIGYGSTFIYADATGVWDIDSEFAAWRIEDGRLWARGSGMDYALGADFVMRAGNLREFSEHPGTRIGMAVKAAIENDAGCGGEPFVKRLG